MKKVVFCLLLVFITFIVTVIISINTIKVVNVENGLITLELFGQSVDYYFEK